MTSSCRANICVTQQADVAADEFITEDQTFNQVMIRQGDLKPSLCNVIQTSWLTVTQQTPPLHSHPV